MDFDPPPIEFAPAKRSAWALQTFALAMWRREGKLLRGIETKVEAETPEEDKPLSKRERLVLQLIPCGTKTGITGSEICQQLEQKHAIVLDESTLRSTIIPKLKAQSGVKNRPRVGYYRPKRKHRV
jgi:hypothetical protein